MVTDHHKLLIPQAQMTVAWFKKFNIVRNLIESHNISEFVRCQGAG